MNRTNTIKNKILQVLDEYADRQANLSSAACREEMAESICGIFSGTTAKNYKFFKNNKFKILKKSKVTGIKNSKIDLECFEFEE